MNSQTISINFSIRLNSSVSFMVKFLFNAFTYAVLMAVKDVQKEIENNE